MKNRIVFLVVFMFGSTLFGQHSITIGNRINRGDADVQGKATKAISSTIVVNNGYFADSVMDISFTLLLLSPDNEYGDSLALTFLDSVLVITGSDSLGSTTGGQSPEYRNDPVISPVITWGDNDNSIGGIEPGAHTFFVRIAIPDSTTGPLTVNWYVSGDGFGTPPHSASGSVQIFEVPTLPDMVTTGFSDARYHSYPMSQVVPVYFSADVVNIGADLTIPTNAVVSCPFVSFVDSMALPIPIITGDMVTLNWADSLLPDTVGNYRVYFVVDNPNDTNPDSNIDSLDFVVSDSVYSYFDIEPGLPSIGFGDGIEGIVGNIYTMAKTDTLTSVDFFSPLPDTIAGMSVVIFEADASGPTDTLVWESDTFSADTSAAITFNVPVNIILNAGQSYFIGVREQMVGEMSIGRNDAAYRPNSHYIFLSGNWIELGAAGFQFAPAINANFGVSPGVVPDTCIADFNYLIDPVLLWQVAFTDASQYNGYGSLDYSWSFGDGGVSGMKNPTHLYTADGTYNVCLRIKDGINCNQQKCIDVTVNDSIDGIKDIPLFSADVYPNPTTGRVFIELDSPAEIVVYSLLGTEVKRVKMTTGKNTLYLNGLPAGLYILDIRGAKGSYKTTIHYIK